MTADGAGVIVVGGGVAGLAVAWQLARGGVRPVTLLEREPLLAAHASGRNAAIYRPLDPSPGVCALAARSRELLDALPGDLPDGWLRRTGLLFVAGDRKDLEPDAALARRAGVPHRRVARDELGALARPLARGAAAAGLHVPDGGVIDIHAMVTAFARGARAGGARIVTGTEVARVRTRAGRVEGVELGDGTSMPGDAVVIAAGAWAGALGEASGCPLPLTPRRRHLLQLVAPLEPQTPVVWGLDDEVYFRPESGGVLASPCDADPWPAGTPPVDLGEVDRCAAKLERIAPALAQAGLRRAWSCLRTAAPDGALVAGADARVRGLFWLAGLGGHGMTVGAAAGELVADALRGREPPLAAELAPARLLGRRVPVAADRAP